MVHDVLLSFRRILTHVEPQDPADLTETVDPHLFDSHVRADELLTTTKVTTSPVTSSIAAPAAIHNQRVDFGGGGGGGGPGG